MKKVLNRAEIYRLATCKFNKGAKEHGTWYPGKIDLFKEIQSELLDLINYSSMLYIEIESLKSKYKKKLRK